MEDKKKKEVDVFGEGVSKKEATPKKGQQKQTVAHLPRDGDNALRQDNRMPEQGGTFGQSDQKTEQDGAFNRNAQRSSQKKNSGQHKESQKKKYQKGHSSGQSDQKQKSEEIKSAADCNFAKENNDFSQENSEEQSGKQEGDDYRRRDTYHRQDKKGRYRRRISRGKRQEKNAVDIHDFQAGDSAFKDNGTFGGDMEKRFSGRKNPEKAGAAPPKKTEYYFERVLDEKTGKAGYVLTAVEKEKTFKPDSRMKKAAGRIGAESANFAHGKVAEVEKENSAVEGAHKTEQKAEDILRLAKYRQKNRVQKQHKKAAQPEKMHFRKEISFRNQKFLEEKPQIQQKTLHNQLQKQRQKERIKREYRIAKQKASSSKAAEHALQKGKNATVKVSRKLQEMARRNMGVLAAVGVMAVLSIMIMASVSSCGAMFADTQATVLASSYLSEPKEIDAADLQMTQLELDLQKKIDAVETDYPNYDEYTYNLGEIGHMPFTLISYLSAVHTEFVASAVESEIQAIFDEMYTLTLTPDTETRTGTRTVTDPDTGEQKEEEYEYTVSILRVTLAVTPLETIVSGKMDSEQTNIYTTYNETGGLLQVFDSPLALYWYNYVSCHYGYRKNPITGNDEFHRGVDIAVPTGTTVYAAHDGTVTTAAYDSHYGNYVVIEKDGYTTKYAHMNSLGVSAGQEITKGAVIGTTGNTGSSTGSHLHIECLYDGEYYNPLFYFEAGEGTLYGEAPCGGGVPGNAVPPESYDDDTVRALMEEAAKYLGYPYVWGGSKPSTSFDCSGYVCWVFTNSGVHSLPRTTAQGIYNKCTPVSSADAKAGDLIFFTGTYNSGSAVSHVGIYCGNGVMIHCGDPIKYSSINTPYWQSHFYGFGRLN